MANNNDAQETERQISAAQSSLSKLTKSLKNQFKQAEENLKERFSVSAGLDLIIDKTKDAVAELKDLDSILSEISKTSRLTDKQLKDLGNTAFETASKYGKTAGDYLTGVKEMYRAGFDNAEQMSALSMLAQAAGGMDSDTANDYLTASNAAYDLKGNVEELNKILDGQNFIASHATISMDDMAQATSEAAATAARYGVQIDELSALIAAVTSITHGSGSDTGSALNTLFENLQDTTNVSAKRALDAVNISMTETVNGSEKLKTPIQLLKELSAAFARLREGDTRRADILSAIGGENYADTLSAILDGWSSYEEMLGQYSQGIGSAAREAEKSANTWEGSMNRLSNTWTDTVENIVDSDAVVTAINGLNGVLSVINNVTNALGPLGSIGLGASLFAGLKNVGRTKMSVLI